MENWRSRNSSFSVICIICLHWSNANTCEYIVVKFESKIRLKEYACVLASINCVLGFHSRFSICFWLVEISLIQLTIFIIFISIVVQSLLLNYTIESEFMLLSSKLSSQWLGCKCPIVLVLYYWKPKGTTSNYKDGMKNFK